MSRLTISISGLTAGWWMFLKSSCPRSRPSRAPEQLSLNGRRSDLLRLFEDILNQGLSIRFQVTGRSMKPFLRGGEILTIRQIPSRTIRRGDLILFRSADEVPVLHRVLTRRTTEIGALRFVTKGDALKSCDAEIHEDCVLGNVEMIEKTVPAAGTVQLHMNSRYFRCLNFTIATADLLKTRCSRVLSALRRSCAVLTRIVVLRRGEGVLRNDPLECSRSGGYRRCGRD